MENTQNIANATQGTEKKEVLNMEKITKDFNELVKAEKFELVAEMLETVDKEKFPMLTLASDFIQNEVEMINNRNAKRKNSVSKASKVNDEIGASLQAFIEELPNGTELSYYELHEQSDLETAHNVEFSPQRMTQLLKHVDNSVYTKGKKDGKVSIIAATNAQ